MINRAYGLASVLTVQEAIPRGQTLRNEVLFIEV